MVISSLADGMTFDDIRREYSQLTDITTDKGFADVRIYPPGTHASVMLLRPDQDGIRSGRLLLAP